ncbi:MAG: aldehyde dehydrogenase family protein [Myxococcota bacterium]
MPTTRPLLLAGTRTHTSSFHEVHAPWDGRLVALCSDAGPTEATLAALAAEDAFAETRRMPSHRRASALRAAAENLADRRDDLVRALVHEAGKPARFAADEVDRACSALQLCAEEAERIDGAVLPLHADPRAPVYVARCFPRGPVLALTSVAWPLLGACERVGPAVAAGCPIVLRPPRQAPTAALILGEALVDAGWPAGAISVLPGDRALVEQLVTDPRFATVSHHGGRAVTATSGRRHLLFDPGEVANAIVEPDAALDTAIPRIAEGVFAFAGQACPGVQRIYVHADVLEEVRERFATVASQLPIGDPAADDVVCGPMIDTARLARAEAWVADAEARGARRLVGGSRFGSVMCPTLVQAPGPAWDAGEVVGPIAVVEPYATLDDAIDRLNAGPAAQDTGLFTRCLPKVWRAFDRIEAGSLVHDEYPTLRPVRGAEEEPVRGGRRRSREAIACMTEVRTLAMRAG